MGARIQLAALATLALAAGGPVDAKARGDRDIATRREPAVEIPVGSPPAPASESPDVPEGVFHTVERGQTLWRVARAYDIDWQELARANGISDPKDLEAGRVLFVPGARAVLHVAPAPAPPPDRHPLRTPPPVAEACFVWPVDGGEVLSPFGAPRRGHTHAGIDIRGVLGQEVKAVGAGEVVYSADTLHGYGKMVIVDHGGDLQSVYAHNSELLVGVGERVLPGQTIARVGRSGNASTEHCHFEVRREKVPMDPMSFFLRPEAPSVAAGGSGLGERRAAPAK